MPENIRPTFPDPHDPAGLAGRAVARTPVLPAGVPIHEPPTSAASPTPLTAGRPGQDAADWLPERAGRKLRMLRQRLRGLNLQREDLRGRLQYARDAVATTEHYRAEIEQAPTRRPLAVFSMSDMARLAETGDPAGAINIPVLPSDDKVALLARIDTELGAARRAVGLLAEEDAELADAYAPLAALLQRRVELWLRQVAGLPRGLVQAGPRLDPPPPGTDLGELVRAYRQEFAGLQAELAAVREAPIPAAAAKATARAAIDALALRGRPNVAITLATGRPPALAETLLRPHAAPPVAVPDATALLAWLCRDQLVTAIERDIDAAAGDDEGLDDAERARRIADLKARMLATERVEESAIAAGEATGLTIHRRPDASPVAVLELAQLEGLPE